LISEAEGEKVAIDMGAWVKDARARGYEKVILVGWSGGGSPSLFCQAEAEAPSITATPAGDVVDLTRAGLEPADGVIFIAAHLSRAETLTEWLEPSVTDELDPDHGDGCRTAGATPERPRRHRLASAPTSSCRGIPGPKVRRLCRVGVGPEHRARYRSGPMVRILFPPANHGSPQPVLHTGDLEHDLIQMPFVAHPRKAATDLVGELLAELARQCRTVSWLTMMPRAASNSSTMRRPSGKASGQAVAAQAAEETEAAAHAS
jgi:hypothetical protein